ncbi:MAG: hypothetical protein ACTSP1_13135, partial [Candidatus Freyarchaeota archaeon]
MAGLAALFLIALILGADAAQMQAVMQQIDDILEYAGIPDVDQAEKDQGLADRLNVFFQGAHIRLYEGDPWSGHGYHASVWGPDGETHTGHVYVYNRSGGVDTLYFEVVSYPYYDLGALPDGLVRELCSNASDPLATPEPLVVYHRRRDVRVPWAGDRTSLSVFLGRMLLLAKLLHVQSRGRSPVELAEQWSNYLDRFMFDFDDLDYIYRNFPLFLENPWLWLKSGSSLNTLMELIGSGVMLSDFSYVSGDNPVYNLLNSVWGAEQLNSLWEASFNQTEDWQLVPLSNTTWVPLPYMVAWTHVLDKRGLLYLYGEAGYELAGANSNWVLTLNGSNSSYGYEFILRSDFDPSAESTLISSCSNASAWSVAGQNASLTTDGHSITVCVAGNHSNTTTLSHSLNEPLNLSGYDSLLLWFRVNATRSDFTALTITLYDEEDDYKEFSTWTYDTPGEWVRLTLDLDEPDSENGTFNNLANITITLTPNRVLNYTLSVDDVRVNSHILGECIWPTDWSSQLINGSGSLNVTAYGFPYVYDYPYSLALEWNLTTPNGSASYVYDPQGTWSLNPESFLTFMLYGFGTENQNTTLTVRLCTDENNTLNYDVGPVNWHGWRKVVLPLSLMNETGAVNLSSVDYIEFELGEMTDGTGMLILSDIEVDSARWVKVEFVVPESVADADGDGYPLIDLYCWNGSDWIAVARWDADDTNNSTGHSTLHESLLFLDGTPASDLFGSQSLCLYPVGTGSPSPYSGDAGNINYTTEENSAGFAVLMPPPSPGNVSGLMLRVEVHYDSTGHRVNTHDYPLALLYFNSSFTNLTLTANDTQNTTHELFCGNGSAVLILNLETAAGGTVNLTRFGVDAENVTLTSGVFGALDGWTVDSANSTVFVAGGESVFVQASEHLHLNHTFNPELNISYDNVYVDLVVSSFYSHPLNVSNLTLWLEVDSSWLNYSLPLNSSEPRRVRIPLNGSTLGGICLEHSTNNTRDWFSVQSIEVFYLTNITEHISTTEGYMNETALTAPGHRPRFTQTVNATELPASLSAWAYVNGSSTLTIEFFDENGTLLESYTATGNGSRWYPVCLVDLTLPANASTLRFIVEAEALDHAYLTPSMLTRSGIYESFSSLRGWFIVGNGTAENNTHGLHIELGENETLTLWTDVSVLGFDFSTLDTIASAYNTTENVTVKIVFEWLLVDADGNTTRYQSHVNLAADSACTVDPVSNYHKIYTPIPLPYEDCVENFTYTSFDLNRIMLNFSGTGQANVSWIQTMRIPDWDFVSVTENVTSTHLYVNWLTKSLV